MEVLLILFLLLILGGVFSVQHAIIKPVVDWLHPEPSAMDPELYRLLQAVEPPQKRKRKKKHTPPKQRGHRAEPDGLRAMLRLLEEQQAKDATKPPPLP